MIKLAIITNPLLSTDSQLLDTLLAQCGIQSAQCLKLCVTTPDLAEQLGAFAPFCCLLLGDKPLHLFAGGKRSLKDWRGYVWRATAVAPGVKCVAAWAMETLRLDFGLTGEQRFYFQRAAREARSAELVVPTRIVTMGSPTEWGPIAGSPNLYVNKTQILAQLHVWRTHHTLLAIDIEGACGLGPACIGFAPSAGHAVVIPFYDVDGRSIWSEEDEIELWQAVEALLEDPAVPKTLQNALYELFVLGWSVGTCICGIVGDTMLKHFELYCELDKSLDYQATLYTQQPHWSLHHREVEGRYVPFKDGRRATTEEWLVYNGIDCCVTYEIDRVLETRLAPRQREHYLFNVSLLVPLAYMSLRGFRYDKDEAARMLADTTQRIYELQDQINQEAASSPAKAELRTFFEALGVPIVPRGATTDERTRVEAMPQVQSIQSGGQALGVRLHGGGEAGGSGAGAAVAGKVADSPTTHQVGATEALNRSSTGCVSTQALLPLLTAAFCQARRTEAREVEEVTWQPMRWNGKRWVRNGKRLTKLFDDMGEVHEGDEEPADTTWDWLKPVRKLVTRNVPVEVASLADVRRFALASKSEASRAACKLVGSLRAEGAGLSAAQRGELATLLGLSVNINSTNQGGDAQWLLYQHWGLTPQYAKDGPRLTDKLTTDAEAAIKAYLSSGKDDATRDQRALTFLSSRWHDTQAETLAAECDDDGRIRCSYNLVGTETHRLSCSTSATGSGYNLQTVTKKLRHLFKADEGCYLCQRDLSGADGWTVAAYAAALGDPNMLEDYRAKLKPAQIIVLMLERGTAVNQLTRDELRPLCKPITEETDWRYFAMKRGQHGWCYLMGDKMTSDQILTDSFKKDGKPVSMPADQMRRIRDTCFFVRYPGIQRWHEDSAQRLMADGKLTASNGFTRQFFGRKADFTKGRGGEWIKKPNRQTLGEWLAHLPQVYTTYATTLALHHLWTDPTNRRPDGSLVVEPIHTVHDSLITQWRIEDTEWAKGKQREWFENEILLANEKIVIPASGTFGPSWGEQEFNLT